MSDFSLNLDLYSKRVDSYTSNAEFDLDRRIQIINEVVPIDLLPLLPAPMKSNPIWRWLIGTTAVMYDVGWNRSTDNDETFDEEGYLMEPAIAKYVNGVRSMDYGPIPIELRDGETRYPTGTRIEVEGVLVPEFDLMLHEAYRYLDKLYPDHPDYVELLTLNEMDDMFESMGEFLDYHIDCKFLNKVARNLTFNAALRGDDLEKAKEHESLKIKYRNLVNNAFRRKLYGAPAGYHALAADIFRRAKVYPLGQYFPILPYKLNDETIKYNDTSKDVRWLTQYEDRPREYDERRVNLLHKKYLDKFRLVDVESRARDYSETIPPTYRARLYSIPESTFKTYEFTYKGGYDHPSDVQAFFVEGMTMDLNDKSIFVTGVNAEGRRRTKLTLRYAAGKLTSARYDDVKLNQRYYVSITDDLPPRYTEVLRYPTGKELLALANDARIDLTAEYDAFVASNKSFNGTTQFLFDILAAAKKPVVAEKIKALPSPWRDGTLIFPYNVELNMYPNGPAITFPFEDPAFSEPTFLKDFVSPSWTLSVGAKLAIGGAWTRDNEHLYVAGVSGVMKGAFRLGRFSTPPIFEDEVDAVIGALAKRTTPTVGILIEQSNGLVAAFGFMEATTTGPNLRGDYSISEAKFKISAIPIVKTPDLLRYIYDEERAKLGGSVFTRLCEDKREALFILFNHGESLDLKNPYRVIAEAIRDTTAKYRDVQLQIGRMSTGVESNAFKDDNDAPLLQIVNDLAYEVSMLGSLLWKPHKADTNRRDFVREKQREFVKAKRVKNKELYYSELLKFTSALEWAINRCYIDAIGVLAVDDDRNYYKNLLNKDLSPARQEARTKLLGLDAEIDSQRANKFLMLDPVVENPHDAKFKATTDSVVRVVNGEQSVLESFEARVDSAFNDMVDYVKIPKLGSAKIMGTTLGGVDVLTLIDDCGDVASYPVSTIEIIGATPWDFLKAYDYEYRFRLPNGTYETRISKYIDANEDVFAAVNWADSWTSKAAFLPIGCIETFDITGVSDNGYNAVAKLPQKYDVEILTDVDVTKDSKLLTFSADASRLAMRNLVSGDLVSGTSVDYDTYIVEVDYDSYTARVNKSLLTSGSFLLYYDLQLNDVPKGDREAFYAYRFDLDRDGLYDDGSPFRHGLFPSLDWPNTSLADIWPAVDVRLFKENLMLDLREEKSYASGFLRICAALYYGEADRSSHYVAPSLLNVPGDLYLDVPLDRIMGDELMDVETLDYFSDATDTIARAGDSLGVGVNLTIQTDTTGTYTAIPGMAWTDPSIKMLARTYHWSKLASLPSYIELGTGDLSRDDPRYRDFWAQYADVPVKERDYEHKSFWNWDVYDDTELTTERIKYLKETGIISRGATDFERSVYFAKRFYKEDEQEKFASIKHISKPIFETALGEYEVSLNKSFVGDEGATYTFINAAIARAAYESVKQFNPKSIVIDNDFFVENKILTTPLQSMFNATFPSGEQHVIMSSSYFNEIWAKQHKTNAYASDSEMLVYDGDWQPSAPLGYIAWPKAPINDGLTHYVTIPRTTVFKGVSYHSGGPKVDVIFNFGEVAFYERALGKWVVRHFRFGGFLGSGFEITNLLNMPNIMDSPEDVTLKACYAPGPQKGDVLDQRDVNDIHLGNLTLTHRMLTRLLAQTAIFKGNISLLRAFTLSEQTEMFKWIAAELDDDNVGAWTLANYGVKYNSISEMCNAIIDYSLDAGKKDLLPETFVPGAEELALSLDALYWFQFLAGNQQWENMSLIGVKAGDAFAIRYNPTEDCFKIFIVNTWSQFFYLLGTERLGGMDAVEWGTFIGENGFTKNNLLPLESAKVMQNVINLPKSRIAKGSVDVGFRLDANFMATGFRRAEYEAGIRNPVSVSVSEQELNVDDDLRAIVTHNRDPKTRENIEYVIEQNMHRYWKNTMYLFGQYQLEKIETNNIVNDEPFLFPIPGVPFDVGDLTSLDRILKVEEIGVRSDYSPVLEPMFFSSYATIAGFLQGIWYDPKEAAAAAKKYLLIGYKFAKGPAQMAEKITFSAQIDKIVPVLNEPDGSLREFTDGYISFPTGWPNLTAIPSPLVTDVEATYDLTEGGESMSFKYFRNTLILEGVVDTQNPGRVDFATNPKLGDAMSKLSANDMVVDIASLSFSKEDFADIISIIGKRMQAAIAAPPPPPLPANYNGTVGYVVASGATLGGEITAINNSSYDFKRVDWNDGYLVMAEDNGTVVSYPKQNVMTISPGTVECLQRKLSLPVQTSLKYELVSFAYDDEEMKWLLAHAAREYDVDGRIIRTGESFMHSLDARNGNVERIGENIGVEVDTYQPMEILDVSARKGSRSLIDKMALVMARDVAFTDAVLEQATTTFIKQSTMTFSVAAVDITDMETNLPAMQLTGVNNAERRFRASNTIAIPTDGYVEFEFGLKMHQDGDAVLDVRLENNIPTDVAEIYKYNLQTMSWEFAYNDPTLPANFVTAFKSKLISNYKTYILGKTFASQINSPENLPPRLPPKPPNVPTPVMQGFPTFGPYLYNNGRTVVSPRAFDGVASVIAIKSKFAGNAAANIENVLLSPYAFDYTTDRVLNGIGVTEARGLLNGEQLTTPNVKLPLNPLTPTSSGTTDFGVQLPLRAINRQSTDILKSLTSRFTLYNADNFLDKPRGDVIRLPSPKGKAFAFERSIKILHENLGKIISDDNVSSEYGLPWRAAYGQSVYVSSDYGYLSAPSHGDLLKTPNLINKLRTFVVPWPMGIKCPDDMKAIISQMINDPERKPTVQDLIDEGIFQNYHDFSLTAQEIAEGKEASDVEYAALYIHWFMKTVAYQNYVTDYKAFLLSSQFQTYVKLLHEQWGLNNNSLTTPLNELARAKEKEAIMLGATGFVRDFLQKFVAIPSYLNKLPPPQLINAMNVAAIVMNTDKSARLIFNISKEAKTSSFTVINARINPPRRVDASKVLLGSQYCYSEGPFNPNQVPQGRAMPTSVKNALAATKFAAYDKLGYQVRIIGDTMFVKSPTATYVRNGTTSDYKKVGRTEAMHWKMGKLPARRMVEHTLLRDMGTVEAGKYVKNMAQMVVNSMNSAIAAMNSGTYNDPFIAAAPQSNLQTLYTRMVTWLTTATNAVKCYNSDEEIPYSLTMNGVTFETTESGKIPTFHIVAGKSTQYTSTKLNDAGFLGVDNYYNYLSDYLSYVLGIRRFEDFTINGIREVDISSLGVIIRTMYDDYLILSLDKLETREDIENYNNWKISSVDPRYMFNTIDNKETVISTVPRTFKVATDTTTTIQATIRSWPIEKPTKAFHIESKYIYANCIVLCGYILVTDQAIALAQAQNEFSMLNEIFPNDAWRHFPKKKYPFISYSNDGGKTFTTCNIPIRDFMPAMKSYQGETIAADGTIIKESTIPDLKAFSIHRCADEIHVWISSIEYTASGEPKRYNDLSDKTKTLPYNMMGYTTFSINQQSGQARLDYNEDLMVIKEATKAELREEGVKEETITKIEALARKLLRPDDFNEARLAKAKFIAKIGPTALTLIGDNQMVIQRPYVVELGEAPQLTRVTDTEIRFDSAQQVAQRSEKIRVLVAINPSRSVGNQAFYLDPKEEYLGADGRFLVTETVETTSHRAANRMFSFREAMQTRPPGVTDGTYDREIIPKLGVPAISEDLARKIYKYYEPYDTKVVDTAGNITIVRVYDYVPAINDDGDNVMLCNAEGSYMVERDSPRTNNFYRLWNLLSLGIATQTLAKAPRLAEAISLTFTDDDFTKVLRGLNHFEVRYLDRSPSSPRMLLDSTTMDKAFKYLFDNNYFYTFTIRTSDNRPFEGTELEPTDLGIAVKWAEEVFGSWESFGNPYKKYKGYSGDDGTGPYRFEPVLINGKRLIRDSVLGILPLRRKENVEVSVRLAYNYKQGTYVYNKAMFDFDKINERALITTVPRYPVTEVFMPPRGYGGDILTDNFYSSQPWSIDPPAFDTKLVQNSRGEPVYLCERDGSLLESKTGLFWMDETQSMTISYNNLALFRRNVVSISRSDEEDPIRLWFFKTSIPIYDLYVIKDQVFFAARRLENTSGVMIDHETLARDIAICYPTINGKRIYNIDDPTRYRLEFRDEDKKLIPGLSITSLGWLRYSPGVNGAPSLPIINGDALTIEVFDLVNGQTFSKKVGVAPHRNSNGTRNIEKYKIVRHLAVEVYNGVLQFDEEEILAGGQPQNNAIVVIENPPTIEERIELNEAQIIVFDQYMKALTSTVAFKSPSLTNPNHYEVVVSLIEKPTIILMQFKKGTTTVNINLPIHNVDDIRLLIDRNWYVNSPNEIRCSVFASEVDLTDEFIIKRYADRIEAIKGPLKLLITIHKRAMTIDVSKFLWDQYIFGPNEASPFMVHQKLLIDGLYGRMLLRKPKYRSFEALLKTLQKYIDYGEARVIDTYVPSGTELFSFLDVADDWSDIQLSKKINYADFNDGKPHNVRIRVLPTNTFRPTVKALNDPNYFIEIIGNADLDRFGFDRWRFNEEAYPRPPMKIGGEFFDQYNTRYYYDRQYINRDGFPIYLADSDGKFIRMTTRGGKPTEITLGNASGDCSADIYGAVDPRYIPREPIYKSAYEWFRNDFFVEGARMNPFWQFVSIREKINPSTLEISQVATLQRYQKVGGDAMLVDVPIDEVYGKLYRAIGYNIVDDKVIVTPDLSFVNYEDGVTSFVLAAPAEMYKFPEYLVRYGIKFKNSFYLLTGKHMDVWMTKVNLDNDLTFSYIVNSMENPLNKSDRNAAIVKVRELGVFDQRHNLILYATFPPVEYRSDIHHFSASIFVRNAVMLENRR